MALPYKQAQSTIRSWTVNSWSYAFLKLGLLSIDNGWADEAK